MRILELEKRGNDLLKEDAKKTDLTNYRYFIYNVDISQKILEKYGIEKNSYCSVLEVKHARNILDRKDNNLYLSVQFYFAKKDSKDASQFGCQKMEVDVFSKLLPYSKKSVLDVVNSISLEKFTDILEKEVFFKWK